MHRSLAAAIALILATAACSTSSTGSGGTTGDPTGGTGSAAASLTVTGKDFSFEGLPETFAGGAVEIEFTNDGEVDHELWFAKTGDATIEQFTKDFAAIFEGKAWPDYFTTGTGTAEIPAGESVTTTVSLDPGTYIALCALSGQPGDEPDAEGPSDAPLHMALGMVQQVTVEEGGDPAAVTAETEITVEDYAFTLPELTAGEHEIVFRNEGDEFHHMVTFRFPPEVTVEQATAAFGAFMEAEGGPPKLPEGVAEPDEGPGTGVVGPGSAATSTLTFEAGTYIATCFIPDRAGGPPHAVAHDMMTVFQVS